MRLKVQLVICADAERSDTIHDVAVLEKDCHRIRHVAKLLRQASHSLLAPG
jgi:hypothetical protein